MDTLGALESFVCAVQSGSLSGAARQRRISQPAISQQITALECQFKTQLLLRGRSGVQMSQSGKIMYKYAVSLLAERQQMKSAIDTMTGNVTGRIVFTTDHAFSHNIVGDVIDDLAILHPDLKIILQAGNRKFDLSAENIDIALRSGKVGDGNGVVRKLGTLSTLHLATPEYLDAVGRPQTPDDLVKLDYIQYKSTDDQIATPLSQGQEIIQVPIKVGLTAQVPFLLFQALHSNLGYAKIPEFLVIDAVKSGQLEVVLPDWKVPEKDIYFAYPSGENHAPGIIALRHALLKRLGTTKGVTLVTSSNYL